LINSISRETEKDNKNYKISEWLKPEPESIKEEIKTSEKGYKNYLKKKQLIQM